jgi:hypothetical protein
LPIVSVIVLTSAAALWFFAHKLVKQRFADLEAHLPTTHGSAIAVPPYGDHPPQLAALCIDLMRKQHCTDAFETLNPEEQRMVLHAHAIDVLPTWISRYGAWGLSSSNRVILEQLRQINTSRPTHAPEHYGAVKALLRSREES